MKFIAVFVFAIAVISIDTIQGFKQNFCSCPPQVIEKPVYVSCPQGNGNTNQYKNCYYMPCNSTNNMNVCGAMDGKCKLFECLNGLYNYNCAYDAKVDNVNMMYCDGLILGDNFKPCSNLQ